MKNFKSPLVFPAICAIMLFFCTISYAQHNHSGMGSSSNVNMNMNQKTHPNMTPTKTATIKVWGKCQRCKDRIEKTVLDRGAITADWNVQTKLLTISYDPAITVLGFFGNILSKAGYDNEYYKAKDKAYNALPECCKYERAI